VREFVLMHLSGVGEEDDTRAAHQRWALDFCRRVMPHIHGTSQVATIREVQADEANLNDVLHRAFARADHEAIVVLLGVLGSLWSVRGEHTRVIALIDAVETTLEGWTPSPELEDETRGALVALVNNAATTARRPSTAWPLLQQLGPGSHDPLTRAATRVLLSLDLEEDNPDPSALLALTRDDDRLTAQLALRWWAYIQENSGDPGASIDSATRALALTNDDDGPWSRSMIHTHLAQMHWQLGDYPAAALHANRAVPVLHELGAMDDLLHVKTILAVGAIVAGRLDEASTLFDEMRPLQREALWGGGMAITTGMAELARARGDIAGCLQLYDTHAAELATMRVPGLAMITGIEPWVVFSEALALVAHARLDPEPPTPEPPTPEPPTPDSPGPVYFTRLTQRIKRTLAQDNVYLDYPVAGLGLFALSLWGLRRDAMPPRDAIRLLVLAERFSYARLMPIVDWDEAVKDAEHKVPGALEASSAAYGTRRGPELLADAAAAVSQLGT
jgi:hypothetical protein